MVSQLEGTIEMVKFQHFILNNMQEYTIIVNPNYTSWSKVGIKINPDNEILRFFLASLRIAKLPDCIINTSKSKGFGVENASIKFFHEMDWEDKEGLDINEGDVNIYIYDGKSNETVLDENLFDKILYDYSTKVLEIYKYDKSLLENWKIEMEKSLEELKIKLSSYDIELTQNIKKNIVYSFFDGIKSHQIINQYDNWLSSTDYEIWCNSYVEINKNRIYIIKENVKVLSTFSHFNKEALELLAKKYDLQLKEENGIYYTYTNKHDSRQLEISENDKLTVIYSIDGERGPERIFIYGVFERSYPKSNF